MNDLKEITDQAETNQTEVINLTAAYDMMINAIRATGEQISALEHVRDSMIRLSDEMKELVSDLIEAAENKKEAIKL